MNHNEQDNKPERTWKVYLLPHENYCGMSSNLHRRLIQHRYKNKRNTDGCIVLSEFNTRIEALEYEMAYQIENGCNGYCFTPDWRARQAKRDLEYLYEKQRKPIMCVEDGMTFNSVRECERHFGAKTSGNLSKHLKGKHKTFMKRTFKYIQDGE